MEKNLPYMLLFVFTFDMVPHEVPIIKAFQPQNGERTECAATRNRPQAPEGHVVRAGIPRILRPKKAS